MRLFQLENIKAGYGEKDVLKNIDLAIEREEFIAIIGPNGAGKSTLLKVLAGNIKPKEGTIIFKETELHKYKLSSIAREVSVVHQTVQNLMPFSVYEFIRMGRFPHQNTWIVETDEDRKIIQNALEITGITNLKDRLLSELSSGERQLVSVAQALAQSMNVMLLDEPISHLDINHSIQIMDILYRLSQNGTTIITVLHDINMASCYCKRVIGIKNGHIFLNGKPQDVITYNLIEELFDTQCVVYENPITKRPHTFPVPGYITDSS